MRYLSSRFDQEQTPAERPRRIALRSSALHPSTAIRRRFPAAVPRIRSQRDQVNIHAWVDVDRAGVGSRGDHTTDGTQCERRHRRRWAMIDSVSGHTKRTIPYPCSVTYMLYHCLILQSPSLRDRPTAETPSPVIQHYCLTRRDSFNRLKELDRKGAVRSVRREGRKRGPRGSEGAPPGYPHSTTRLVLTAHSERAPACRDRVCAETRRPSSD